MTRTAGLIAMAGALLLSACGGSDPAPLGSPENPQVVRAPDGAPDPETGGGRGGRPSYTDVIEGQSKKPQSRLTPCSLMSIGQAQRIIGMPLRAPVEAPQGPTCIYRSRGEDTMVTVSFQDGELAAVRKRMLEPDRLRIGSRVAYCGLDGRPVLYLQMTRGRLLAVAAPCSTAERLARVAVARLSA